MGQSTHTLSDSDLAAMLARAYAYGRHDQKTDTTLGRIGNRWLTSPQFADAVRAHGTTTGDFDTLYRELATDTGTPAGSV